MGIKVVVGEAKPCSDLASKLAMVYELLLRRAAKADAEAERRLEKPASPGKSLTATPGEAREGQTLTTE